MVDWRIHYWRGIWPPRPLQCSLELCFGWDSPPWPAQMHKHLVMHWNMKEYRCSGKKERKPTNELINLCTGCSNLESQRSCGRMKGTLLSTYMTLQSWWYIIPHLVQSESSMLVAHSTLICRHKPISAPDRVFIWITGQQIVVPGAVLRNSRNNPKSVIFKCV